MRSDEQTYAETASERRTENATRVIAPLVFCSVTLLTMPDLVLSWRPM